MKIGIDLDGVVYNFVDAFRQYLVSIGLDGAANLPEPDGWNIWEFWSMSKDNFDMLLEGAIDAGVFWKGKPYPGAIKALYELRRAGHDLHIVTARRPGEAQRSTKQWLNHVGLGDIPLDFSMDKTSVACDLFIEDNVDNARALAGAGVETYLFDRPWNQGAAGEWFRVTSWEDFVEAVEGSGATRPPKRTFETGACRDTDEGKLDYEGFNSPLVLRAYAEYMHKHRQMPDGSLRSSDNWQNGMPLDVYAKSLWRHFMDWHLLHRGHETTEGVDLREALLAMRFNIDGYLHELLKETEQ